MTPHSIHKVLGYSRQRDWGGEIGEEECVEGQSVVVGQTLDILVRSGGDVVCRSAAERVHRWQLVSFKARQRGWWDSRLRKKKGINIKINDKEKSEARRRLTIVVGVGVITTVEMTVVANGVGASEEMNEGRQDEARQS
jgi:hypothetical protein